MIPHSSVMKVLVVAMLFTLSGIRPASADIESSACHPRLHGSAIGMAYPFYALTNNPRANLVLLLAERKGLAVPWVLDSQTQSDGRRAPFVIDDSRLQKSWGDADVESVITQAVSLDPVLGKELRDSVAWQPISPSSLSERSNNLRTVREFLSVLAAESGLSKSERTALAKARLALGRNRMDTKVLAESEARSGAAVDLERYLLAAQAFYAMRFDTATVMFKALEQVSQQWVAEAACYMAIRCHLNLADQREYDDIYGQYVGAVDRDQVQLTLASIEAYLARYPAGRYVSSASNMRRRAARMSGDANVYQRSLESMLRTTRDVDSLIATIQEYNQFAQEEDAFVVSEDDEEAEPRPVTLQTQPLWHSFPEFAFGILLKRMAPYEYRESPVQASDSIGIEALPALDDSLGMQVQASLENALDRLAPDRRYRAYLECYRLASVKGNSARIRRAIEEFGWPGRDSVLAFSFQVVLGISLERDDLDQAVVHWRKLLEQSRRPEQALFLQMVLGNALERTGRFREILATSSPCQHMQVRLRAIKHTDDRVLLREIALRGASAEERGVALKCLLVRELTSVIAGDKVAATDLRSDALLLDSLDVASEPYASPFAKLYKGQPLSRILRGSMAAAESTHTAEAWLDWCDFYREHQYQYAMALHREEQLIDAIEYPNQLVISDFPEAWPMTAWAGKRGALIAYWNNRLAVYEWVLGANSSSEDHRSRALFRMVMCFRYGGHDCTAKDIPLSQRREWFLRLKREYPHSIWANNLKYYY